jgi:GH25 family lysozyme M1 (1,4-beta-N-acetylmuramidase)
VNKVIDVSSWQGEIDFTKVKKAGVGFVIIRAGYGNSEKCKDKYFEQITRTQRRQGLMLVHTDTAMPSR